MVAVRDQGALGTHKASKAALTTIYTEREHEEMHLVPPAHVGTYRAPGHGGECARDGCRVRYGFAWANMSPRSAILSTAGTAGAAAAVLAYVATAVEIETWMCGATTGVASLASGWARRRSSS